MATIRVENLYERQVKPLAHAERLKLLALIASDLAIEPPKPVPRQRSLLELEGLGAEIWQGIDAQEYVNELRKEWDHRP